MNKPPLPPHVMEKRRMAHLKVVGSIATTIVTLLLFAAPWIARYALHWSVDSSAALGVLIYPAVLPLCALVVMLVFDTVEEYNYYKYSIDKHYWDNHQREQDLTDRVLKEGERDPF